MQKVINSHFHIWTKEDLTWLAGPMVPRIFGPYESIRRDYLIEEYLADREGSGIEKAVYVQTNWPNERFEDEVAWVSRIAEACGWPHAIVGYANMADTDVRPQLDRLKAYPMVRGVRMQLHWHETPEFRFAPTADQVLDPNIRANVARLREYGYSFDLQLFPSQMLDGAQLVSENPEVDFILTHAGMLTDMSDLATESWQEGLRQFSSLANFSAKLSGLGTFIHKNDPVVIAYIVGKSIEILGSDRLMFGSNFPIEKMWTDYRTLMSAYREAIAPHGEISRGQYFLEHRRADLSRLTTRRPSFTRIKS